MLEGYYSFSSPENRKEVAEDNRLTALPVLNTLHYEDWQYLNGIICSAALRIVRRLLKSVDSHHAGPRHLALRGPVVLEGFNSFSSPENHKEVPEDS